MKIFSAEPPTAKENRPDCRRHLPSALAFTVLGLISFTGHGLAQTQEDLPPPSVLKNLSLEELMDIDMDSVSMRPEKLLETASAIQEIQRGAYANVVWRF